MSFFTGKYFLFSYIKQNVSHYNELENFRRRINYNYNNYWYMLYTLYIQVS